MATLERIELISSKKDILLLFALFITLLTLSLSYEYIKYSQLTQFNSQLVHATLLKQYTKTKKTKKGSLKSYQVLKFKANDGYTFYSTASKNLPSHKGKELILELWAGKITFLAYLRGFFAYSKIITIVKEPSLKQHIEHFIDKQHSSNTIRAIYNALFLAAPLPYALQKKFSNLGISHLIAISGFHLSVLAAVLFFLIKYPYSYLQNSYFPYRSKQRDTFMFVAVVLLVYMLFIGSPPSLLRAYIMLLVGFYLYEKGIKIISMQTLLLSALLIIALFPRLLFSIGLFLSFAGVFYIFLFLIYFQNRSKKWQFVFLPFWVYLMMLPYSIVLFGNFSLLHPLSIVWTSLFTLFYPFAILLHLFGYGNLLDTALQALLHLHPHAVTMQLSSLYLGIEIVLSLLAVFKKEALFLLLGYVTLFFVYAIYHVT